MTPVYIEGATVKFTAPEGVADCGDLIVKAELDTEGRLLCSSAWEPSADELLALLFGASVVITIVGHQPMVAVSVSRPPVSQPEG